MSNVLVDRELLERAMYANDGKELIAANRELRAILAQPAEAEGVEVVGWRIGFPNGSGYKLYEQRQDWAYEGYGSISYEVQDLMTVAQHERIVAALSARPAQRERIDPFSVAEAIRKALDRNSCPNVFLVIAYEAAIKALSQQAEPVCRFCGKPSGDCDQSFPHPSEQAPAQTEQQEQKTA